jgi:uncharacterized protein
MVPMEIGRKLFKDLWNEIREPQALILTGPRQVGKTTLMRALEASAKAAGMRTRYLDLEQPSDLASLKGGRKEIIDALVLEVDVVFVDEFYYLEDAGRIFKAIYDRAAAGGRRVKIVASGSSSVEIHGHLKESLAGRTITYRIFPLSYEEYRSWDSKDRPDFGEYLRYGGLPGLSRARSPERKQRLLQEYLSTYIFKDIKGLIREENIRAFNQLLYILAQNQGQLIEASGLARDLGLTPPTISSYLTILDRTYVNLLIPSYHTNLANELKKSRKTYLFDLGIRNIILKDFRPAEVREDRGGIYESHVLLTLLPLLQPNMELRFWRTKKQEEVDFVLLVDRQPFPIEVKTAWDRRSPPPGISAFCRRYPNTRTTFTIGARGGKTLKDGSTEHRFVAIEDVAGIPGWLR